MIEKIQIVSGDFWESLEGMNYESVGRLFMAVMAYSNDKDPKVHLGENIPALTLYPVLKNHIERHEEYRQGKVEAGRKGGKLGGAPKGNKNAEKQSKTNQNKAEQSKTKQNKPPNPNPYPNPNPIYIKRLYGECNNVSLTDDEFEKIRSDGLEGLIDELSLYIASKGDKYKSHYAVIRQWANRRKKEREEKERPKSNQFTQGAVTKDYDFEEIMKRKQVN